MGQWEGQQEMQERARHSEGMYVTCVSSPLPHCGGSLLLTYIRTYTVDILQITFDEHVRMVRT